MSRKLSRRLFVQATAAATVVGALPSSGPAIAQAPTVLAPKTVKPVVVASANGHEHKNGGRRTCVQEAFARITRGEDPLDALIAGVNILELDPAEDGVGYGG